MYSNKKKFQNSEKGPDGSFIIYIFKKIEMNNEPNKQCTQT